MAGQPKKRAMAAELTKRTSDAVVDGLLGDGATILDYAEQWVASGKTLLALADEIGEAIGQDVMREALSRYLHTTFGPEANVRLEAARRHGAHGLAERALVIVDEKQDSREGVARAKNRSDMRLRIAGYWNRAEYGEQRQAGVTINVGNLHIDALRARPLSHGLPARAFSDVTSVALDVTNVALLGAGEVSSAIVPAIAEQVSEVTCGTDLT